MKKSVKVLASLYQTDTPFTHVLEVFKQIETHYDVELIIQNTPGKSSEGIKIRPVPLTQYKIPLLRGFLYELYAILYVLTSKNTDIIYDRLRPLGFASSIIYKFKKIPVIVEVNGIVVDECRMAENADSFLNTTKIGFISSVERNLFSISDKIISVTPNIKKKLEEMYDIPENKVVVIENGANHHLFQPIDQEKARSKLKLDKKSKYVVFAGGFAPWHGLEFLIHAAKLVENEFSNAKFLIVGDGTEREKIMKLVEELNLKDKFIFTGRVPYEEVPWYINAGDICVAPFIRERNEEIGLSPLKIYEYSACEKPVVSSRIPNLEFIEEQEAGILVEPDNSQKLALALIKLLKDDKLRNKMGKNGRKYIIENNSWDVVKEKIEKIFDDVSPNNKP